VREKIDKEEQEEKDRGRGLYCILVLKPPLLPLLRINIILIPPVICGYLLLLCRYLKV
jgi:hypothetical protein